MLQALMDRVRQAHTAELEGGEGAEAGFTLIELMVVLLILAILMAIAIPTFLGVTAGANDRATQSNLTNAVTEASAIYQGNNQSFATPSTGSIASAFSSSAPEFNWTSGACTGTSTNCISYYISTVDADSVILAAWSKTNTCWYVLYSPANAANAEFTNIVAASGANVSTAGTFYAKKGNVNGTTGCSASTAGTTNSFAFGTSYSTPGTN